MKDDLLSEINNPSFLLRFHRPRSEFYLSYYKKKKKVARLACESEVKKTTWEDVYPFFGYKSFGEKVDYCVLVHN